ncbi:hypothetical protein C475_11885 [Halosimplex carlsbadense 2-9-1]|uniref:Uncharacterized protein n=1 Tax=Halosimplex carlsbadense 2-9-1 TaxID=797114 RepID=M0CNW5_9EURY|nr:hypothetical protein [Halosimplex carlsbadense]ELZ24936.1 hypothetical protein C475_11885 [Halosimplex carlsbadense 2-9-1]
MAKFTLLEVHLDGAEFTANAPYSDGEPDEGADGLDALPFGESDGEAAETAADDGGSSPFAIILTFAGMILAVVALRRILGGSGEPVLDDSEPEEAETGGLRARL